MRVCFGVAFNVIKLSLYITVIFITYLYMDQSGQSSCCTASVTVLQACRGSDGQKAPSRTTSPCFA